MRYSGLKVITEGLFGNKGWKPAWRDPSPKAEYDVIIIGGGGNDDGALLAGNNHANEDRDNSDSPNSAGTSESVLDAMATAMTEGTYARIELLRPFIDLDKTAIATLGDGDLLTWLEQLEQHFTCFGV